ncbi:hypothetical protein AGABI2DRAFT_121312 [Agaricus bisporus var. bisporus H97]|uniref:hypothetical protein n=1 Tax=Agaricus bisporus var. bisporus (strain H97 / ATCC MYA-4626 / FGSC 10389) TaxID=936046 RepID=UPI00029F5ED2|nr:hypothetical protein AGABI2DRAFT_121312 [Agaricus bisporus var. bisporus H97]EKV44129.1 hypothetical protein AGABI2DRAFT_121312 [Agaricus bisporus var. bisporus H97]
MDIDTTGDDGDWSDEQVPEGMFKSSLGCALLQAAGRMEDELELLAFSRMTAPTPPRRSGLPEPSSFLTPLSQKGMIKLLNTSILMLEDICSTSSSRTVYYGQHTPLSRGAILIGTSSLPLRVLARSQVDPLPLALEPTPPPPTPSGTATPRPRSPLADMDMTPHKSKKAKPAQPTPPPPPKPPVFGKDPVPSKNNTYAKAAANFLRDLRPPL